MKTTIKTLIVTGATLAAVLTLQTSALAQTLATEDFSGDTLGSTISGGTGGTGWSGAWGTTSDSFGYLHTVRGSADAPLSYPGYAAVGGNYLNFAGGFGGPAYMQVERAVSTSSFSAYESGGTVSAPGTTLWGSFAYRNDNGTAAVFFGGNDVGGSNYLNLPGSGGGVNLALFSVNYGAGNADTVNLWIDPSLSGSFTGTTSDASFSGSVAGNFSFTTYGFALNGDTYQTAIDNVLLGTSSAAVNVPISAPEPSSMALLAMGAIGLFMMLRRREHTV